MEGTNFRDCRICWVFLVWYTTLVPYKDPKKRKEYHKAYSKKWEVENKDKRKEIDKRHYLVRKGTPRQVRKNSEVRYRRHHRNKVKVLETYGKQCNYCGESKYECLVIDHINDDGVKHRQTKEFKKLSVGGMIGYCAVTEYRPDLYQILCHNCNAVKQYYKIKPGGEPYKSFEEWKELSKLRNKKHG